MDCLDSCWDFSRNKLDETIAQQQRKGIDRKRQFWNNQTITLAYQLFGHLAKIDSHITQKSIDIIENSLNSLNSAPRHVRSPNKHFKKVKKLILVSYNHSKITNIADAQSKYQKQHRTYRHPTGEARSTRLNQEKASTAEMLRSLGIIQFNNNWQGHHFHQDEITNNLFKG